MPLAPAPPRVLTHIVEQHAEEAAFLWLLRDRAVDAPHYAPRHLARLEERVEAHLDGLRVAGATGFEIAMAGLDRHREMGEMFAAAALALEAADPALLAPIVEIAASTPEARRGLFGAIGWVGAAALKPWARAWLDSPDPFDRLLGVVALSHHRIDPGPRAASLLTDPDPTVRARAYRLAGELDRADLRDDIARAIGREGALARDWATWAAASLGDPQATAELEPIAEGHGPVAGPALEVLVRRAPPARVAAWIRGLNGDPGQRRLVARALGGLGDPAGVPWLIARMSEPELARVAGESFSLVTGADLALLDLDGEAPRGAPTEPGDDALGGDLDLDPDEHLPWPEPELVLAWWDQHSGRFTRGRRYIVSRVVDANACEAAWASGLQRQRRAAAHELAVMREAGTPLHAWRARVCRPRTH